MSQNVVPFPPRKPRPEPVEPLWREAVGHELRRRRREQERTLADVAGAAGISVQYLSEVERGLKEPSSEILGAVGGALGLRLLDLTAEVTRSLLRSAPSGPARPAGRPAGPLALAA